VGGGQSGYPGGGAGGIVRPRRRPGRLGHRPGAAGGLTRRSTCAILPGWEVRRGGAAAGGRLWKSHLTAPLVRNGPEVEFGLTTPGLGGAAAG